MIDNPKPTIEKGRFDCPICGKPASCYVLQVEKGDQMATYYHARVLPSSLRELRETPNQCKVRVMHG